MKKILTLINTIVPIIFFILLILLTDLNDTVLYIIMLTLFIGFIMPYVVLLITGISMLNDSHHKMALTINIFNIILLSLFTYLLFLIVNRNLLTIFIEYIIMLIISIVNVIYLISYLKKNPNLEYKKIKEDKKKNNGAIV